MDELPNGWTNTTIGEVVTLQRGHDITQAEQRPGPVPVVSSGGISSWHDQAMAKGPGVVLGRKGTLGRTYYIDCDYWPHDTTLWVRDFKANDPRFVYYFFSNLDFRYLDVGSANPTLNRNHVHPLPTIWPPVAEQRAIAEVLGALDDKIRANRKTVLVITTLLSATWKQLFGNGAEQGWPTAPIGDMATVVGGTTPKTAVAEFWDGSIAWATPRDLSRLPSAPLLDTERHISDLGLQQIGSGLLPAGTVLLSSRAPIGYLAIAEVPMAINQGFIALVERKRMSNLYLWQWISAHMDEVKSRANGTTFLEVNKASFRTLPIDIPPEDMMLSWTASASVRYQLIVATERESQSLAVLRDVLLPKLLSGELRVRDAEELVRANA